MKKAVLALVLAAVTLGGAAVAELKPDDSRVDYAALDHRRTLWVPFGQDTLMFEAPKHMCFLDSSYYLEAMHVEEIRRTTEKGGKETLMAAFMDCLGIANIDMEFPVRTEGSISWMNPAIGEKSDLPRADYLDLREASFNDYLAARLAETAAWKDDSWREGMEEFGVSVPTYTYGKPHRSENGVMLGYTVERKEAGETIKTVGIAGATLVRGYPVDVMITFGGKGLNKDLEELYPMMDKFLMQQVALNE